MPHHRPLYAVARQFVRAPSATGTEETAVSAVCVVDLRTDSVGHVARPLLLSRALPALGSRLPI
eukprot:COSAG06_NODE_61668_length_267_cov_0.607143_1_plen_63_part_01